MRIGRITAAIIIASFFLIVISSFSLAQYAGCCCDLSEGTSYEDRESEMEVSDCPSTYNIIFRNALDLYENRTCVDVCSLRAGVPGEGEEPPPPAGTKCGDVGHKPGPTNLRANHIKGEKQISLSWNVECPVDYFKVGRCTGFNCNDFEPLSDQVALTVFKDDSAELLWDEDYTYEVIAHYNLQGDSESATFALSTGDIECLNIYDSSKFCLSQIYYNNFADYFKTHGYKFTPPGDFIINYTGAVRDQFFANFNKAFLCGDDNKLSSPDDICARRGIAGGICISDAGEVDCVQPSDCQSIETEGLFGLYSTTEGCEGESGGRKFCYFDRSKSIIDTCFACSQDMACSDYRSSGACERDNCGMGDCVWKDIYPDIGIGVCVDQRFSACNICNEVPSGGSSEAFNEIFEQCSEEKSNVLATAEYPCYWKSWQSLSCDEVTCATYKRKSECASPAEGITLYPDNSVKTKSLDTCEVGVCQWRADPQNPEQGDCLKNADGDTGLWPDCNFADDPEACESDFLPPDTTIVASGALGVYDRLNINIFDKISRTDPGEYKTGSKVFGYTTYFCHYPEGQAECNVHASPFSTDVGTLTLNYLTLHNTEVIEEQTKLTDLAAGYNIIKYYSVDSSSNPGLVKEVTVFACTSCVGPQIIRYYFEEGVEIGGKHYTNSLRPGFHANFNVDAEITTAEINNPFGELVSYTTYSSENGKNYTFVPEVGLAEGNYQIRINAKDSEGTFMNNEFILPFTVDLTAGLVNFTVDGQAAEGITITKSRADVSIEFSEDVSSVQVFMNGENATGAFSRQTNRMFLARNLPLEEGIVVLRAVATDFAENIIDSSVSFEVNAKLPVVKLRYPSYGVSSKFKFNLTAETLNRVNCRFLYDVPIPENFSYTDFEPFDMTNNNFHTITDFTRIPDGDFTEHVIHVFCLDSLWGLSNATFTISVDTTPPRIQTAYADPEVIKEAVAADTYQTLLKVNTDEITFCQYSETTTSYEDMESSFPGYIVEPHIPWPNREEIPKTTHIDEVFVSEQNRSYEYYAACEDLAGWQTPFEIVNFSVDLTVPFGIEDHTIPPQYKNSTSVVLAIETNKRSFCFYGRDTNSITNSFQQDGEYSHTTNLVNVPLGENTFYVQCFTKYETPKETSEVLQITFTVDTTLPFMTYVNDTSNIVNDPEYSYFKDTLRVNWLGDDNESPVTRYYYMIETFYGKEPLINWTATIIGGEWIAVTGLNLTDDWTYKFLVKPENAAGLVGEVMESNGVTVDFEKIPQSCSDSVFAGLPEETDVDCGGACPPCEEGLKCEINIDCQSGFCDNTTKTCKAPSCSDSIMNGDEVGIDCGGSCEQGCGLNSLCISDSDCDTGNCINGLCAEPDPCYNGVLDGTETGIDCGGSCASACGVGGSCMGAADCASGLCVDGLCAPRKSQGEECVDEAECEEGLICREGTCTILKSEEGESCGADSDCYDGLICFEGSCSKDSDGDGLPDEWELRYGLDPFNPSDALFDSDNDGLSNADEYARGTNPTAYDSDGDKWGDGKELEFGTDPLDGNSKPSPWLGLIYNPLGYWWLWLLILIVLSIVIVLAFYGYRTYQELQKKKKAKKHKAKLPLKKPLAKPAVRLKTLTPEQRRLLQRQAEKDKEIVQRLEKLRGMIEKKAGKPGKKVTEKEWVDIRRIMAPIAGKPEMKPVFKELNKLKKGKLGILGRKQALKELERLLGKEKKKVKKGALEKEEMVKKKKTAFEKLESLGKKAKKARLTERKRAEKNPLERLKLIALTRLSPAERKEVLEKLVLLRTGKLSVADRKELFEKLRITAEYYKKNKAALEEEIEHYVKKKRLKKKRREK